MVKPVMLTAAIVLVIGSRAAYNVYDQSRQEIGRISEQLTHAQQVHALREELASELARLEQAQTRFAPAPDAEWLIRDISQLAQESGIDLAAIVPQPPQPFGEMTHLAVTLQARTPSYHQLGRFVDGLEHLPAVLRIEELSVSKGSHDYLQVRMTVGSIYAPAIRTQTADGDDEKDHT